MKGVDNGKLWFDHVRIPAENILNKQVSFFKEEIDTQGIRTFNQTDLLNRLLRIVALVSW